MMRRANMYLLLLALCDCARQSLPPPVVPLVATPEQSWRRSAPPLMEPRVFVPPEISKARLSNGITLLSAAVVDAPYDEIEAIVPLDGERADGVLLASALAHALRRDLGQLPPDWEVHGSWLRFGWRCEPDRIEDALRAIQLLFSGPPAPSDLDWARRGKKLQAKRERLSLMLALKRELQERLGVEHTPGVRARSTQAKGHAFDARSVYTRLFNPANAALVIAGAADATEARNLAERYLGGLASEPSEPAQVASDPPRSVAAPSKPVVLVRGSQPLAVVAFGFAAPAWTSPLRVETTVLAKMLDGSHVSSMLNASLREERGLTYVVDARYEAGQETGILWGYLEVDNTRVADAIELLQRNFKRLQSVPQEAAFSLARQRLLEGLAASSGRVQLMAAVLVDQFTDGSASWFDQSSVAQLTAIDAEALRVAAQGILARPVFVISGSTDIEDVLERAHLDFEHGP